MRIIAGTARGRQIRTLQGLDTRPTLDRVREAVFGSLQFDIPGSTVLDLFSGSGGMGLEALSRGAQKVVCNDLNPACVAIIRENAESLGLQQPVLLQLDYNQAISRVKEMGLRFDFVFLDPPYASGFGEKAVRRLFEEKLVLPGGRVILEHAAEDKPEVAVPGLTRCRRTRKFGSCAVTEIEEDAANE